MLMPPKTLEDYRLFVYIPLAMILDYLTFGLDVFAMVYEPLLS